MGMSGEAWAFLAGQGMSLIGNLLNGIGTKQSNQAQAMQGIIQNLGNVAMAGLAAGQVAKEKDLADNQYGIQSAQITAEEQRAKQQLDDQFRSQATDSYLQVYDANKSLDRDHALGMQQTYLGKAAADLGMMDQAQQGQEALGAHKAAMGSSGAKQDELIAKILAEQVDQRLATNQNNLDKSFDASIRGATGQYNDRKTQFGRIEQNYQTGSAYMMALDNRRAGIEEAANFNRQLLSLSKQRSDMDFANKQANLSINMQQLGSRGAYLMDIYKSNSTDLRTGWGWLNLGASLFGAGGQAANIYTTGVNQGYWGK